MHLRIYATALILFALLVGGTAAQAKPEPSQYAGYAKQKKKCKRGYHRVKRHGKARCVKRRRKKQLTPTTQRSVRLAAHIAPTVKRNPLNPFEVTYDISASATAERTEALATFSEPTSPPDGVLALYSDGVLECAVNVGAATVGDECPVDYDSLGAHRVTTIYTAGAVSATDTRLQQVDPLSTETSIVVTYADKEDPELAQPIGGWWWVGNVTVSWDTAPFGPASGGLVCPDQGQAGHDPLTPSGCLVLSGSGSNGTLTQRVYAQGSCREVSSEPLVFEPALQTIRLMPGPPPVTEGGAWPSVEEFEDGSVYLRAVSGAATGYATSEARAPLQLSPTWRPTC